MNIIATQDFQIVSGGCGSVGAAIGTISGVTAYASERVESESDATTAGFIQAAAAGVVGGFVLGPAGARALRAAAAVAVPQVTFYSGMAGRMAGQAAENLPR